MPIITPQQLAFISIPVVSAICRIALASLGHPMQTTRMHAKTHTLRWIAVALFALSLPIHAQSVGSHPKIVLPNPQLIQCNKAECSQLWAAKDPDSILPSQVLTDVVDGTIVGLTAVYDKSVSIEQLRAAVNERYRGWQYKDLETVWRDDADKILIQVGQQKDGSTNIIYLQLPPKVPTAHLEWQECTPPEAKATKK